MKKLIVLALALAVLVVMMPGAAVAAPPLHKATGGGEVMWGTWSVTYGFTALQVDAQGNAKGQFQFIWHGVMKAHAQIQYLAVNTATGDAWLGGVFTKGADPGGNSLVGKGMVIRVQDNGEGSKASGPDMVGTLYLIVDPAWALLKPPLSLRPWTNGNVQVK